jgi:hypothetical protein
MFKTIGSRINMTGRRAVLNAAKGLATMLAVGIGGIVVVRGEIPSPACYSANNQCPSISTSTCQILDQYGGQDAASLPMIYSGYNAGAAGCGDSLVNGVWDGGYCGGFVANIGCTTPGSP